MVKASIVGTKIPMLVATESPRASHLGNPPTTSASIASSRSPYGIDEGQVRNAGTDRRSGVGGATSQSVSHSPSAARRNQTTDAPSHPSIVTE